MEECGTDWRRMFRGVKHLALHIPLNNITPEHFVRPMNIPVEFMVMILSNGGWLCSGDWETYVRFAIANRIMNRKDKLFTEPFDEFKDDFMKFQKDGGSFVVQKRLRNLSTRILRNPISTRHDKTTAKLVLSTLDSVRINTLIQPFHWIRASIACSEPSVQFGHALANVEMQRQKVTLVKMLRSS